MTHEEALYQKLAGTLSPPEHPEEKPAVSAPINLRNLFSHPDTHPIVLNFCLLKALGPEWYGWEPETIWDEVEQTFGVKDDQFSELNRQKIRALQALTRTELPWSKWQVFEKVAQPLNNNLVNFTTMQILAVEDLMVAVDMMETLRRDMKFSDEVKLYLAASVLHDDIFFVPPPLDFIQLEVSQPHYRCNDCGTEESALFHDGVCSACTQRMAPEQGLSLLPKQDLLNAGRGKNLSLVVRYDPQPIEKLWNEWKDKPSESFPMEEKDPTHTQVFRLLMARDHLNSKRGQLAEQLVSLKGWLGTP